MLFHVSTPTNVPLNLYEPSGARAMPAPSTILPLKGPMRCAHEEQGMAIAHCTVTTSAQWVQMAVLQGYKLPLQG